MKSKVKTRQSHITDDSKMPFGKYEGAEMKDVPKGYLVYLRKTYLAGKNNGLTRYIDEMPKP